MKDKYSFLGKSDPQQQLRKTFEKLLCFFPTNFLISCWLSELSPFEMTFSSCEYGQLL